MKLNVKDEIRRGGSWSGGSVACSIPKLLFRFIRLRSGPAASMKRNRPVPRDRRGGRRLRAETNVAPIPSRSRRLRHLHHQLADVAAVEQPVDGLGAFSSPSTIVSRCTQLALHQPLARAAWRPRRSGARKSRTMKPCTRSRFIRMRSKSARASARRRCSRRSGRTGRRGRSGSCAP